MLTELFERAAFRAGLKFLYADSILAGRTHIGRGEMLATRVVSEHRFPAIWSVIARLTDEMFRLVVSDKAIHESSVGYSVQFICCSLTKRSFKFGRFRVCCPKLLFQFVNFVARGRLLFLQRQRRILNVDYSVVDRLLHLGELQVVPRGDCCFGKVNCIFQPGNGCRYGHDRHVVPRLEMDRARPRQNHHSALAVAACARGEFA